MKKKIAVVEDEASLRQIMSAYLAEDYEVETFPHGLALVERLDDFKPDCIVSDIAMPYLDGLRLRQLLAQNTQTDIIPFIFQTANKESDILDDALNLGVDDYLEKPITKQTLLNSIKRVLIRHQQASSGWQAHFDASMTQALLPNLPETLGDLRLVVRAGQASAGGGDFVLHFPGEPATIVLGDVMGHGMGAKYYAHVYAGYLQGLLASLAEETFTPAELLQRFSAHIYQDDYLSSIVITCTVIQAPGDGTVIFANSSQVPVIHYDKTHYFSFEQQNPLLGLNAEQAYCQQSLKLGQGRCLLSTDGLWEIKHKTLQANHEKACLSNLQVGAELPLSQAADELQAWLAEQATPLEDDWTFVLLEAK
jgi:phosphoserine phosphatase RsbU/P